MSAPETATTSEYLEARERDWSDFVTRRGALPDYWAAWQERSFDWKVPIDYLQPVGMESPASFEALQPVLDALRGIDGVDVAPIEWLHLTWCRIGFLRAADIMWSQVESFYVNSAPRLRRIPPTTLYLGGISVADGERVYLGVDDGGMYRTARRHASLAVPKVGEVLQQDPTFSRDNDRFVPRIDIAFFTGAADRARVVDALEPFREIEVGSVALTHTKLARLPILPHSHFEEIDVVAEIPMLGDQHRGGYHN